MTSSTFFSFSELVAYFQCDDTCGHVAASCGGHSNCAARDAQISQRQWAFGLRHHLSREEQAISCGLWELVVNFRPCVVLHSNPDITNPDITKYRL
uniref:Uncharacterized protein n=1 Tax=Rhipicephalus zambeziensis TaxID=60191 RepID=A0A224YGS1_9ACAR